MERGELTYDRGERLSVPAIRKDGDRLSVEFTVTIVRDRNEELAGIAAVLRDVTDQWEERQEREERIRELEERIDRLEADRTD